MFVVFAEIAHAVEIVVEHIAIVMRQAIVVTTLCKSPITSSSLRSS